MSNKSYAIETSPLLVKLVGRLLVMAESVMVNNSVPAVLPIERMLPEALI